MSEYIGKTIGEYQIVEMFTEDENTMAFKGFQPGTNNYVLVTALKPHVAREVIQRIYISLGRKERES